MGLTQVSEKGIKDGEILNADINASAAIAKSKIESFVNNNSNNRVITGSNTTNTLEGEANLTYNGQLLQVTNSHINISSGYSYQWGDSHERIEQSDGKIEFFTGNTEKMTLSGSNLGIGTTSPAAELHVTETGTGTGTGAIISETASGGGNAGYGFRTNGTDRYSITLIGSAGSESLRFRDDQNSAERMRIDASGDIGLGTTTPNLSSFASPVTSIGKSANPYSVFELQGNNTSDGAFGLIVGYNSGGSARTTQINFNRQAANNSGSISFETASAGSLGERVRITNDGLTFNGDTATANALDDYEEGTATFQLHIGGSEASGVSYSYNTAPYTKIGRQVFCQISMFATNLPTTTGGVDLVGLPFNDGGGGGYREPTAIIANHNMSTPAFLYGALHGSSNKIRLRKGANSDLDGADFGTVLWLHGSITYTAS